MFPKGEWKRFKESYEVSDTITRGASVLNWKLMVSAALGKVDIPVNEMMFRCGVGVSVMEDNKRFGNYLALNWDGTIEIKRVRP